VADFMSRPPSISDLSEDDDRPVRVEEEKFAPGEEGDSPSSLSFGVHGYSLITLESQSG